jgi:hypothetical protein
VYRWCFVVELFFLVCILLAGAVMGQIEAVPEASLPEEFLGWKSLPGDQKVYDSETLYDYIDGGAELYLSYGFRHLVSRRYVREGESDIIVDLFDMGDSQNAFGVFLHSREVVESRFGQGSQYTEGLLLFWKGRYYVSILASPETAASRDATLDLARRIDASILEEGRVPDVVALLPREGLVEESIRFFRHYIWLNSHYYVADENILHIDDSTDAVLAKYEHRGGESGASGPRDRGVLLVVRYGGAAEADAAYGDFTKHYLPELSESTVVRIEDDTWTGCRLSGNLIVVVFNCKTDEEALQLVEAVLEAEK